MTRTLLFCAVLSLSAAATASDWPAWRGPLDTGYAPESAAVTSWSPEGENVVWHVEDGGRTTPVVHDGRVYYNAPIGEGAASRERVVCLDAETGRQLWDYDFNVFHTDIVENRVGWTAVVVDPETGNVYCHATGGELFCWDRDGKLLWKHSMTEMFGRISGYGGRLMNPIVDENRVIVNYLNSSWGNMARGQHRYVAFDKHSGDVLWWSQPAGAPEDTTYATPVVAVIDGRRMLIAPAADGNVYGLLSRTGEKVWEYRLSKRGLNTAPVVSGNYVYVTHSEENLNTTEMGSIVCIDATKTGDITDSGTVWRLDGYGIGYASPALANGRLYVVSNSATLYAIDARTGQVFWEHSLGRVGKGSPVVTADGVIYVGEQNGIFHILKDNGDAVETLDVHEFSRDRYVDEIFGSPAVVDGRVYFMTRYNTYCLGNPGTSIQTAAMPEPAHEAPPASVVPAHVLVVPGEVTLRPGQTQNFELLIHGPEGKGAVRVGGGTVSAATEGTTGAAQSLFESLGPQLVGELGDPSRIEWSVKGLDAQISETGTLAAGGTGAYSAGTVTAKLGDLEASARVRVIPELPITVDFDHMSPGSVPPGWIGAPARTAVVEQNGNHVLQKLTPKERPSPPFMRLRAYATAPIEGGCTTQCDMMSEKKQTRRISYLPDMGMINSRYRFIMMGAGDEPFLRIETWSPVPRIRKDVPFAWKPDTWYTAKFEVRVDGGKAICRGKVWPQGQEEPDGWQIEVEDPYPNTEGSAGIYAYSTGTTPGSDGPATYFDNFKVYENE